MSAVDWTRVTVAELKEGLKQKGLPITGKKDELQERMLASLADADPEEMEKEEEAAEEEEAEDVGGEQAEGTEEVQQEEEEEEEQPEEAEEQEEQNGVEEETENAEEHAEENQDDSHQEGTETQHEELMIDDDGAEFLEEEQIEDIVGEVDEMADFAQPTGLDSEEEQDSKTKEEDEEEEDIVLENGELVIPNKREMRKDMLVDHRLKTVIVYPIEPTDLDNEVLRTSFENCLDFGTKFYNVIAKDGTQSINGYAQLHFEHYTDAVAAVDSLQAIREGVTVKRQKPDQTHEEIVAEVDRGKRIPLKSDDTHGALLVTDLPTTATEQQVLDTFTGALAIFIARDDDCKSKGYAYVDYGDREAATAAIAAHKDVEIAGKKVVLTDYHTKLQEGIPEDEKVEPDATTGRLIASQRDLLLRRLRSMRSELGSKKRSAERTELLERRVSNIRAKLARDSRVRNKGREDTADRRGGDDRGDYKRRRVNSWGSRPQSLLSMNRGARSGTGYQPAQSQAQTMNLLVGLSQMLNQQQQQRDRYRAQASGYQRQAGSAQDKYYGSRWGSRR